MTRYEYSIKYPIGTFVKYLGENDPNGAARKDIGKVGRIVKWHNGYDPVVFLQDSTHVSRYSTAEVAASWGCSWEALEILPQKGRQLLFNFMY